MESQIQQIFEKYGVSHLGFAALSTPLSLEHYKNWIDSGLHGEMEYLQTHIPFKQTPQKLLPQALSAIVFTYPYHNEEWAEDFPLTALRVAAYAKKRDYHLWLKAKMAQICVDLKAAFPSEEFLGFTDSAPIMERDLAHRAGLGWFGKNSCIIDKKNGSFFFIAEIFTSLQLATVANLPQDHCGTCRRCIEACPTDAILENKTIDSNSCIAYWTIESKKVPPVKMREAIDDIFFGCDICQDVCPWNRKTKWDAPNTSSDDLTKELKWILTSSNKSLLRALENTPLARAGGRGLKRNAMIVAANKGLSDLQKEIETFVEHPELGELAQWALSRILQTSPLSSS